MKINYNKLRFTLIVVILNFSVWVQSNDELPEGCPTIVSRIDWGGNAPTGVNYLTVPVPYVIIHHTVSQPCNNKSLCITFVQNIQAFHQIELDYWDVGYNFLIGNDGNVYEGAGWHREAAHTLGYNKRSIGIAFIGDFSTQLPTTEALTAAHKFLQCGIDLGELAENYKLYGARQVSATASPGLLLYQNMQNWPNYKRTVE